MKKEAEIKRILEEKESTEVPGYVSIDELDLFNLVKELAEITEGTNIANPGNPGNPVTVEQLSTLIEANTSIGLTQLDETVYTIRDIPELATMIYDFIDYQNRQNKVISKIKNMSAPIVEEEALSDFKFNEEENRFKRSQEKQQSLKENNEMSRDLRNTLKPFIDYFILKESNISTNLVEKYMDQEARAIKEKNLVKKSSRVIN